MTVTYSNVNNMISCILFNFSLCLVGFTFGMLFFSNRNLFPNFYYTSIFATIFGIVGAISFVGVAFTPSNLFIDSNEILGYMFLLIGFLDLYQLYQFFIQL